MGYFYGKAKFSRKKEKLYLVFSLIIPIVFHSIYNLILNQHYTNWIYLMVPFLIVLWIYGLYKIKAATTLSPFRNS